MHRITDRMRITQKPEVFFSDLCEQLKDVIDAEKFLVLCSDTTDPTGTVRLVASSGRLNIDRNIIELLWRRTQEQLEKSAGILLDSNVDGPLSYSWPASFRSLASVPIRREKSTGGMLVAINKIGKADFDGLDTKLLLSLANESAMYLDNFRLYQDLQDLLIGSLRALTSSIDAKDRYTRGHSERVAVIARWLAQRASLSAAQVQRTYLTGLLHDVGKIGVSELVLSKPGRLEADEFEQIKKHPQIGSSILAGIRQMADVSRGVLSHHERFDGSGYPAGIHGTDIPLTGRIVMLADCFDAMTSDRTYRRALPLTAAKAQIRRFSGTQFDPDLSDALLDSDLDELVHKLQEVSTAPVAAGFHAEPVMN